MRTYDEPFDRDARLRRPVPAPHADRAADAARANQPPNVQALDQAAILNLQRLAGNAAVSQLLADGAASTPTRAEEVGAPQPRFDLAAFSPYNPSRTFGALPDKGTEEVEGEQDQSFDVGTFAPTARGVKIVAEASGVFESTDYPDGFKFTQVIDTNAPLHGASSPYVDPHPNDDTKPFYWTDAEQAKYPTTFKDKPSRNPPTGTNVTYWRATLALNGVNETTKTVTGYDYMTYGFTMDAAGNVKVSYPASADGAEHRQQLANEWSGWTFN